MTKSQLVYELSDQVSGVVLSGPRNTKLVFFNSNRRPNFRPFVAKAPKTVAHSLKKFANPTPSLQVERRRENAESVRKFIQDVAGESKKETAIAAEMVNPDDFKGYEILSLNGIEDPNGVLDKNYLLYQNGKTDPNNMIHLVPDAGLSKSDRDFVTKLEGVTQQVHELLVAPSMMRTEINGKISKVSHLQSPVIHLMDSGDRFENILQGREPIYPGHVTNINRQTKKLEVYCSVVYYNLGLVDKSQMAVRIELMSKLYPDLKNVVTGLSKFEFDHFDGIHYHKAFDTDYRTGIVVALPSNIHQYFTNSRQGLQEGNLFQSQAHPTIELRIDYKHNLNLQIIRSIPKNEFPNYFFTKSDLETAFTFAADMSKVEAKNTYTSKGFSSHEYFAGGRARHAVNQIRPSLSALEQNLEIFIRYPAKVIDRQKVATSVVKLFDGIQNASIYTKSVKHQLRNDANSVQPILVESWIDQAFEPFVEHVNSVLGKMERCGFDLQNPQSYFYSRSKKAIIPSIDRNQYVTNLRAPLITFNFFELERNWSIG